MWKKLLLLSIFLLIIPSVLADVNVSVNVTPPLPPIPYLKAMYGGIYILIISAGTLLFLVRTFIEFSNPEEKIEVMILGAIVLVLAITIVMGVLI
jgi:hypothetical protein